MMQNEYRITEQRIEDYRMHLVREEKEKPTIEKYIRNIRKLMEYASGQELTKDL